MDMQASEYIWQLLTFVTASSLLPYVSNSSAMSTL